MNWSTVKRGPKIAKLIVLELHRNLGTSLEEVIKLAQQAEIGNEILQKPCRQNECRVCQTDERPVNMQRSYANNNPYQHVRCYKCNKMGHKANNCKSNVPIIYTYRIHEISI